MPRSRSAALAKVESELDAFPKGWKRAEFDSDLPGREFNAGGLWLLVSFNHAVHEKLWWASIFHGGDVDAAWTKDGFPTAVTARQACATRALAMLREAMDSVRRADGR